MSTTLHLVNVSYLPTPADLTTLHADPLSGSHYLEGGIVLSDRSGDCYSISLSLKGNSAPDSIAVGFTSSITVEAGRANATCNVWPIAAESIWSSVLGQTITLTEKKEALRCLTADGRGIRISVADSEAYPDTLRIEALN